MVLKEPSPIKGLKFWRNISLRGKHLRQWSKDLLETFPDKSEKAFEDPSPEKGFLDSLWLEN